jgi:4-alpha-glucanotransferase
VRIDHFRALSEYYSIPASHTDAKNGKWIKGPGMKFIKAMKDACGDKLLIAEDLGVITDDVAELVKKSGWPGMKVLQFGFFGDFNSPHLPHNYPENCIAYTGTHDNNTLLGYVFEADDNTRSDILSYFGFEGNDFNGCFDSILREMFQSHAGTLIIPVQDLLLYGADTRFNKPGVAEGNWGFRVTDDQLKAIDADKFLKWNRLYGRTDR